MEIMNLISTKKIGGRGYPTRVKSWLVGFCTFVVSIPAHAEWGLNMTRGVTPISRQLYDLHMTIFWICVAIALVVFGVLIYALIYHRKSRNITPAAFHEHTSLEIAWAIIPFIILVVMAVPATKVLMKMDDTSKSDVTIKVTGYQWKWQYEYLDQGISFFSNLSTPIKELNNQAKKNRWYLLQVDNVLVVPTDQKIRFLVTSSDVIHSWWVPALGIKRDAIPGFIHEAWARIDKPGIYRGQCAELCGVNHGYMPIVVKAVPEEEFNNWVKVRATAEQQRLADADKNLSNDELMQTGKQVYERYCAVCHKADGTGMPPVFPGMKGSSVAVGRPISRHINIILNGVSGTAMQAFGPQLSDKDIAAVITYERNAFGNNTGDMVQPPTVKAVRNNKPIVDLPSDAQVPTQASPTTPSATASEQKVPVPQSTSTVTKPSSIPASSVNPTDQLSPNNNKRSTP